MYLVIFLVLLALADIVAPNGFTAEISKQAPLVACSSQDIRFDWIYATSTGVLPETSRWFYKNRADDIELMYTLLSNTEGRSTRLFAGRIMFDVRTHLHDTGITLINVTQNDNGMYYVELSFRLGNALVMISNEDSGTSLTVINCPKETPEIHKDDNRTIHCSSSEPQEDLELAIFKDGKQQHNVILDGDMLKLTVENSSHGNYYCGYIYPSRPLVDIIGAIRNSSTIHIKEVNKDKEDDDKNGDGMNKSRSPLLILGSMICGTIVCVALGIIIGYCVARKRNKKPQRQEEKGKAEQLSLHSMESQGKLHSEATTNHSTVIEIGNVSTPDIIEDIGKSPNFNPDHFLGSGEPNSMDLHDECQLSTQTTPLNCESSDINANEYANELNRKYSESVEEYQGHAVESTAYTEAELKQTVKQAYALDEDTKIAEEVPGSKECVIL